MPELVWSEFKLRLESSIEGALDAFLNKRGAADGIIYSPDRKGREHDNRTLTSRVLDTFFTQVEEHLTAVENTTDRIEDVSSRIQIITARTTAGALWGRNEVPLDDVDYRCWAFIVTRLSYSNDFSNETIQALYREHEEEIGRITQSCTVRTGDSREKSKLQYDQCRRYLTMEVVESLLHNDIKLKEFSQARKDREEEKKRAGEAEKMGAEDASAEKQRALEAKKKREEEEAREARAAEAYIKYQLALTSLDITFLNAKIDKVFNFVFLKAPISNAWTKVVNAQLNQASMNAFRKNLVVGLFTGIARYAPEPFKTVAEDLTKIATSFLSADAGSTEQPTKAAEGSIQQLYDTLLAIKETYTVQVGYRIDLEGVALIVESIDNYAKAAKTKADEAFNARKKELFGDQSSSAEENSKFEYYYPQWLDESNHNGERADEFDIKKKVTELFNRLPEKQFVPACPNKTHNNTGILTDYFALYMFASFVVESFLTVGDLDPSWDINGAIDNPYSAVYNGGIIPPAIIAALNNRGNDILNIILPPPESSRFAYNSRDRHSTVSIPVGTAGTNSRLTMGGGTAHWEVSESGRYKFPSPPDEKHSHAFALICLWITKKMNPFEKALNDTNFATYHENQKKVIDYWTTAIKSNKNPTSISQFKSVFRGSGSGDWTYEGPQGILRKVRRTWNIN